MSSTQPEAPTALPDPYPPPGADQAARPPGGRLVVDVPTRSEYLLSWELKRLAERAEQRALKRTLRSGSLRSARAGERAAEKNAEDHRLARAARAVATALDDLDRAERARQEAGLPGGRNTVL